MSIKIKHIVFKKNETFIGFVESMQPRDSNEPINDKNVKRSDLPRHADFERAMDKLKPHLLIACELQEPMDYNGNMLKASHFNDYFADSDEEKKRFGGLEITGVLIQGKHAEDGVQIFGTKTTSWGAVINLKTPSIALKPQAESFNYPLVKILDDQIDKLLTEADLYNARKKHGAGMQQQINLPNVPAVNTMKKVQGNLVEA